MHDHSGCNVFANANEVRWCPGCGDYAILMALQRLLSELGVPPERHVFISGIGCAGRLPYYMNTYGFHTIHGRAAAIATGLKAMRDDLEVWVITGDGDCLSIGGNHLIHCLRRNVNLNILLFNNQIYGLTKGQFSPTSHKGSITKTSPDGVKHEPLNPLLLALAAGASFVARSLDKDPPHLMQVLRQAYEHNGCSFIEIYQDCNIFNHGAFDDFALKRNRAEHTLALEAGEPLVFGAKHDQMLALQNEILVKTPYMPNNCYNHNITNWGMAAQLARLTFPEYPVPLGVYYKIKRDVYGFGNRQSQKTINDLQFLYKNMKTTQL